MQIYVKKITSLHPNKYKFITIDQAHRDYWRYIESVIGYIGGSKDGMPHPKYVKNFRLWLTTEI